MNGIAEYYEDEYAHGRRDAFDDYMHDEPRFACVYCGKQHMSRTGMGNDVACCGEIGHVEQVLS